MKTQRLADDVYHLGGLPPYAINVYLIGDVLIDAGTRFAYRRILPQLRGHTVRAHALTHAHPDHQGSTHVICERLSLPLWCSRADAEAAEDPAQMVARLAPSWLNHRVVARFAGPGHPVDRRLEERDEVAGFRVLATPGHTAGHVAFWRESDRVLLAGDVVANMSLITRLPKLREAPRIFTADPAQNRESARRLAALEPSLVCFGHGPPLRNPKRFCEFVATLGS